MAGIQQNRRTQYTIKVIKEAFINLLTTKELSKITVTEICQNADVNRGTFYTHFKDTYALFHSIETELVEQIRPLLSQFVLEEVHDWLTQLIILIKENETISRILLSNYQETSVFNELFKEVYTRAVQGFQEEYQETNPIYLDYYFSYFVEGSVGAILNWLENDDDNSVEGITKVLLNVLARK